MLKPTIEDALNAQIQAEFSAAYLYLSMAAYFESINLPGFAAWFRMQWQEEESHALRLFDYVHARDGRVSLRPIKAPETEFESPRAVAEQVLKHEQDVTVSIEELYELATRENDYATQVELQWFITEQVEEEKMAGDLLEQVKRVENDPGALFILDRELGTRRPEAG